MPHETRFKVKRGQNWVDVEDLPEVRDAEQAAKGKSAANVDVASLPHRSQLDPEMPLDQLFFEHPEVRSYITADGKPRMGISPEQHCKAEEILRKYGGPN